MQLLGMGLHPLAFLSYFSLSPWGRCFMNTDGHPAQVGSAGARAGLWVGGLLAAGLVAAGAAWLLWPAPAPPALPALPAADAPEVTENIRQFCSSCHVYPPPEAFPRADWGTEIERAFAFARAAPLALQAPPYDAVIKYYEEHAPLEFPPARFEQASGPPPVHFARTGFPGPKHRELPAISNVNLVHLRDKDRLDLLACDMRRGQVLLLSPYAAEPSWKILAEVSHPAHVEIVDLDKDGVLDILVASLGNFLPTDSRTGSVVWLRGRRDGGFTPITLLADVGRVADVRAADFDGDGKLDLVVAAFGWNQVGSTYLLRNKTTDWSRPVFESEEVDGRHGAIHVPVCDLNKDGKPDFVALISQQHETVVAFLNDGKGHFQPHTLYTGPHPAYGSSGIELVDLDRDGDLDVLYTNGDVLDKPYLLKPYHSVQWLENKGDLNFEHHHLTPLYGAHRAVAADMDGDGLLDIVAVSFLPADVFPQRKDQDAVILLHQESPGRFVRYSLEKGTCDHVTCAVGDVFHKGRQDLVIGNFLAVRDGDAVALWKNLPPPRR